jgi:hypothetical protein
VILYNRFKIKNGKIVSYAVDGGILEDRYELMEEKLRRMVKKIKELKEELKLAKIGEMF